MEKPNRSQLEKLAIAFLEDLWSRRFLSNALEALVIVEVPEQYRDALRVQFWVPGTEDHASVTACWCNRHRTVHFELGKVAKPTAYTPGVVLPAEGVQA